MKLVRELVSRSAHSRPLRASALNHEVRNHTVKNQPVIKRPLLLRARPLVRKLFRPLGQSHKIRHRIRRLFLQQPNHNIPLRSLKNRVSSRCPSHRFSFFRMRPNPTRPLSPFQSYSLYSECCRRTGRLFNPLSSRCPLCSFSANPVLNLSSFLLPSFP